VGGDAGQVHPAVFQLDEEQHVQAGQADGLDGEEVTGDRAGGLGAQELRPGLAAWAGCRTQAV
jgi:hypothetical protein